MLNETDAMYAEIEHLKEELDLANHDCNEYGDRCDELEDEVEHLKERLALTEEELNKAMHRSTEWESEVYRLRERLEERDKQGDKNADLASELSRTNRVLEEEKKSLKAEINRLTSENKTLEDKAVKAIQVATAREAIIADLEEESEALRKSISGFMVWVGREIM